MKLYEKQLLDCLDLKGLSERTKYDYLQKVKNIAQYFKTDPTAITITQIEEYFLHLIQVKKLSPSTVKNCFYGLRFFYIHVVKYNDSDFKFYKSKIERKLPVVISTNEVSKILQYVKVYDYQIALRLMYGCGLRISEVVSLKVADINSNLGTLTIRNSKGNKDRSVPLPQNLLSLLRKYWKSHRNELLLFPTRKKESSSYRMITTEHIKKRTLHTALKDALKLSAINKRVTSHTLRHSYATNLLNIGVSIVNVSKYLGHKSLKTTMLYLHMTSASNERAVELINQEMDKL